jgi:lipopolysaccharide transport system permease protein
MWMAPIIFPPALIEQMPQPFVWLLLLNPFSHLVWCYQDVLYFGEFLHPVSWVIVAVLSVVAFYGGYRVFRRLKTWFGEVL